MTALVTINQGTAPAGSDGDTVRSAFSKVNANVGVLQAQAALTSATGITTAQALTVAHVGKRVNISLSTAGVVNLPAASTCTADSVILLRNIGTTVVTLAITTGSGDTVALSKLNPGESALMDTDGAHAWNVLTRGRSNSDNEIVNGNCTVNGNETVGGTLAVSGATTLTGGLTSALPISSGGTGSTTAAAARTNLGVGRTLITTKTAANNSLVFTGIDATYNVYEFDLTGIVPGTSGVALYMQFSNDGGATWISSAGYTFALNQVVVGTGGVIGQGGSQTAITVSGGLGNAAGQRLDGTLKFYSPASTGQSKMVKGSFTSVLVDNAHRIVEMGGGLFSSASALPVNAVIFFASSGNLSSGTISMYGVNK